jgi:hypothetical protein
MTLSIMAFGIMTLIIIALSKNTLQSWAKPLHRGGSDPACPGERVVGVVGDGEGSDDEVGDDGAEVPAQNVDVRRHPLVRIVQFVLV